LKDEDFDEQYALELQGRQDLHPEYIIYKEAVKE